MSTETKTNAQPLGKLSEQQRSEFLTKPGNLFYFGTGKVDLREIDYATAKSLAMNPQCMFIVFKDATKRPPGQKGWLHEENKAAAPEGKTPAPKNPPAGS